MDVKDASGKKAEDEAGAMVIRGGGGGNTWCTYLQPGGLLPDARNIQVAPTIGYGPLLYVDDPPQAEAIVAASTMPATVPSMGYLGGGLNQGSTQSPAAWLSTNLHGTRMDILPLLGMEISRRPATARGQQYTRRTPEEQKGPGGPSPCCSQQMLCTDQHHSPGGQFTAKTGAPKKGGKAPFLSGTRTQTRIPPCNNLRPIELGTT
jgi:hypothetical protein